MFDVLLILCYINLVQRCAVVVSPGANSKFEEFLAVNLILDLWSYLKGFLIARFIGAKQCCPDIASFSWICLIIRNALLDVSRKNCIDVQHLKRGPCCCGSSNYVAMAMKPNLSVSQYAILITRRHHTTYLILSC